MKLTTSETNRRKASVAAGLGTILGGAGAALAADRAFLLMGVVLGLAIISLVMAGYFLSPKTTAKTTRAVGG